MKKIKVVSYCTYKSLGSILQAYALQTIIRELGYDSCLLMDCDENKFHRQKTNSIKGMIKYIYESIIFSKVSSAYSKRMQFINEKVNIMYKNNFQEFLLEAQQDDDSIYLSGSDQVWNPINCNPVFFLEFVKEKKCVSYAASMGNTNVSKEKVETFAKMLEKFENISVREEECAKIIRDLINKEIDVHIDPTFLISAESWRKESRRYNVKEPYILLYMLYWDKSYKAKIKKMKKETGLKVYAIADGLSNVYADEILYDVGVQEFLWLIDHAEYIITSSFHGTAFATIFNKKFSALINPKAPSRISNLLQRLSVPYVDVEELQEAEFDYKKINKMIQKEKERSITYLKKVLE